MNTENSVTLHTGSLMHKIGFGTWDLKSYDTLKRAIIDHGYRHIDTASIYGNEAEVGKAVREAMEEGNIPREELFITTKLWVEDFLDPETAIK